jgi:cryptochrome
VCPSLFYLSSTLISPYFPSIHPHTHTYTHTHTHNKTDPEAYIAKLQGKPPPTVYQSFVKLFLSMGPIPPPSPPLDATMLPTDTHTHTQDEENDEFKVPTLVEMGYPSAEGSPVLYPGGETEGLRRLRHYLSQKVWVANFEKPQVWMGGKGVCVCV